MNLTTLDIIKTARELISDSARWTQEAAARDSVGRICRARDQAAVRWSGTGALYHVADDIEAHKNAIWELHQDLSFPYLSSIGDLNDQEGHVAVLALFDRTIARLESEARS